MTGGEIAGVVIGCLIFIALSISLMVWFRGYRPAVITHSRVVSRFLIIYCITKRIVCNILVELKEKRLKIIVYDTANDLNETK